MSNGLIDQRVLVIGGSSGIGEATALQAAQAGARVTIASRSPERLAGALARLPRGVTSATLDASDADDVATFFLRRARRGTTSSSPDRRHAPARPALCR